MSLPAKPKNAGLELTDILHRFLPEYEKKHSLTIQQKKAVSSILSCRTPLLGGYIEQCDHCNEIRVTYHSCKNRHCPKCQFVRSYEWTQKRSQELLPVHYFHCVFTIPDILHPIFRSNSKECYRLLFKAVSETLLTLSWDKKRLGATPAITAVLHTWTQRLLYHPHIHCIVSGGGLSEYGKWIPSARTDFLFHVLPVGDLFKKKLIHFLRQIPEVKTNRSFYKLTQDAYEKTWNPNIKPPFAGPQTVLNYLSQYTHRIAISNRRILSIDDEKVSFTYKNRKTGNQNDTDVVPGVEFLRRFLQHVLPFGFVKIRHYGLLANKKKASLLQLAREVLDEKQLPAVDSEDWQNHILNTFGPELFRCPLCKHGVFRRTLIRIERVFQGRGP